MMREKCTEKGHGGEEERNGAPPDPPILADAKGGRRTEGRERAEGKSGGKERAIVSP